MKKDYFLIASLYPILLLRAGVFPLLFLTNFNPDTIFITDLLGRSIIFPYYATAVFGLLNMFLLFLIAKHIFGTKIAFWAYIIYGVSPWTSYIEFTGSIYVFLLALILTSFYGLILVKSGRRRLGFSLFVAGILLLLYSSLLMWIVVPLLIWSVIKINFVSFNKLKIILATALLFCLPVLIFSIVNFRGLKNITKNQITIFSNPGLISVLNKFQGENMTFKFKNVPRIIENKYTYLGQHLMSIALTSSNPINFFTPQIKLLDFSFSPPILLGFIISFTFGLFSIRKWKKPIPILVALFALYIPSLLSRKAPDFSRLMIFSPIIFIFIALGLKNLLSSSKIINKYLVFTMIILVVLQLFFTFSDILTREPLRLYYLYGQN